MADGKTTTKFSSLLPIELDMIKPNSNESVVLPCAMPVAALHSGMLQAGDIMLRDTPVVFTRALLAAVPI